MCNYFLARSRTFGPLLAMHYWRDRRINRSSLNWIGYNWIYFYIAVRNILFECQLYTNNYFIIMLVERAMINYVSRLWWTFVVAVSCLLIYENLSRYCFYTTDVMRFYQPSTLTFQDSIGECQSWAPHTQNVDTVSDSFWLVFMALLM